MSDEQRNSDLPPAIAKRAILPPAEPPRRLLTTSRAAKHLGIEESEFRAAVARKAGPAGTRPFGHALRYDRAELDRWAEEQKGG